MKRLKITIKFKTNPIITNPIYFDAVIYSLLRKKQLGNDYYNLPKFRKEKIEKITLNKVLKREKQVYLASKLNFKLVKNYTNRLRKRWNENSANQWCKLERVYTNQKTTKNYDLPFQVSILKNNEAWWYCIGDEEILNEILKDLIGVGKEIGQGYGLISSFKIEETKHKGVRNFPIYKLNNLLKNDIIKVESFNPPYSNKNKKKCVIRKF